MTTIRTDIQLQSFNLTLSPVAPEWFRRIWLNQPDSQGQYGQIQKTDVPSDVATPGVSALRRAQGPERSRGADVAPA